MGLLIAFLGLKTATKVMRSVTTLLVLAFAYVYLTSSFPQAIPTESAKVREEFCSYVYHVDANTIPVCSTEKLTKKQIRIIDSRLIRSLQLYKKFAATKGHTVNYRIPLTIYVMDVDTLNDERIFGSKFKGQRVVGRYTEGVGHVYVTFEMFESVGITDLQHELGHYGNDHLGLHSNNPKDEKSALEFERYYRRHVY